MGMLTMLASVLSYMSPKVRLVESDLPDAITDSASAEVPAGAPSKKYVTG
jgi:hypothetical protein